MTRRARLGDVIDDYCTRCRMIMNHGIVGMVGDEVAKVRCNTCQSEHAYKHGRLPKKRRGETDRLFDEVLRGIRGEPDPIEAGESAASKEKREAEDSSGDGDEPKRSVHGRTRAATQHARKAAGHLRTAAKQGRAAARQTRPADKDQDDEREEARDAVHESRGDEDRAGADDDAGRESGMSGDSEDLSADPQGAPPRDEEVAAAPGQDAERPEDPEPSHGVRRKLFTIRRHSGGKPPVAGVTTDGSAERRAAQAQGHGGRQGQQGGFGGRGGPGGPGGHGGHGGGRHGHGGGGRQDQQGRWSRRRRRG
jgi:hypothetical protein